MSFQYSSSNRSVRPQSSAVGNLSFQNPVAGDFGSVSSFTPASRPALAQSSGMSLSGKLTQGSPRVTSGATAYSGADPAAAKLDQFSRVGQTSDLQSIARLNQLAKSQAEGRLSQLSKRYDPLVLNPPDSPLNSITLAIDRYNNSYNRLAGSIRLGNSETLYGPTGTPAGVPGSMLYFDGDASGSKSEFLDSLENLRNVYRSAASDSEFMRTASPEFLAFTNWLSSNEKDVRNRNLDYQRELSQITGSVPLSMVNSTGTQNVTNDENASGRFGRSGFRDGDYDPSSKLTSGPRRGQAVGAVTSPGYGVGWTDSVADYNPFIDAPYNSSEIGALNSLGYGDLKESDLVYAETPYAPYPKTGYGGRFNVGNSIPKSFVNRDLSSDWLSPDSSLLASVDKGDDGVVKWDNYYYDPGDKVELSIGSGRELFNNNTSFGLPVRGISGEAVKSLKYSTIGGSKGGLNLSPIKPGSDTYLGQYSNETDYLNALKERRKVDDRFDKRHVLEQFPDLSPEEADSLQRLVESDGVRFSKQALPYHREPQQVINNYQPMPNLSGGKTVSIGNLYSGIPQLRYTMQPYTISQLSAPSNPLTGRNDGQVGLVDLDSPSDIAPGTFYPSSNYGFYDTYPDSQTHYKLIQDNYLRAPSAASGNGNIPSDGIRRQSGRLASLYYGFQ